MSHSRDLLSDQLDDRGDGLAVLGGRQHKRAASPTRAAGAADAMDIILGVYRYVEAEDVAHAFDVKATGCDVAGDKKAEFRRS